MVAATNKSDLLDVTRREYDILKGLIERVPPDLAVTPDDDGWSVKDVVAHRAHWIGLFLGWVSDADAGRTVHMPAKGYKWTQLKPYNEALRSAQSGLNWAQAIAALDEQHGALLQLLTDHDDTGLYGTPMTAQSKWTKGRYAEASGASHYRSASKFIRARLRAAQT